MRLPHYKNKFVKSFVNKFERVLANKYFRQTCFYTLLFLMAVLTLHDMLDLIFQYRDENKQAKIKISFNDTVAFPNMTFCFSKRQAWSHFKIDPNGNQTIWDNTVKEGLANLTKRDAFLQRRWPFEMVVEAYQVAATLSSMERETTAQGALRSMFGFRLSPRLVSSRKMVKMWLAEIRQRNVTFQEFQQKAGIETLKRSLIRFQRLSFNADEIFRTRIRITWISLMELCFSPEFDAANYKDIEEQGEFFTITLSHNMETLDDQYVECGSVDMHGRPSRLAGRMEGKGRIHDGMGELCLGHRVEVEVSIHARYILLSDDDGSTMEDDESETEVERVKKEKMKAVEENSDNGGDDDDEKTVCRTYEANDSEFDCRSRCRMAMIRRVCACTPLTLSYLITNNSELNEYPLCDYEQCTFNATDIERMHGDTRCAARCVPDCIQMRYDVTVLEKGRASRPDLTEIIVYWTTFEYLEMEQVLQWTFPGFMAALGGSIGLWLGLSILSLIQFTIFLSAELSKKVKKKQNRQKVSAATTGQVDGAFGNLNDIPMKQQRGHHRQRSSGHPLEQQQEPQISVPQMIGSKKRVFIQD